MRASIEHGRAFRKKEPEVCGRGHLEGRGVYDLAHETQLPSHNAAKC